MCRVRIYVPTTLAGLATTAADTGTPDGRVEVAPVGSTACAVTPALREWYREGDLEELEYAALTRAALGSLRLLAATSGDRRVVLAADVPDNALTLMPDVDPAGVLMTDAVHLDLVVAAHVDDPAAAADVRAALAVLAAADAGDDDARFVVESLDDHELQWYAVQEIPFLIA
ncbi:MAG: hypothetical protein QOH29_1535 [Actinomycetota bacterium]|nr:hypothetical protein [Actinomycetota bacterium]